MKKISLFALGALATLTGSPGGALGSADPIEVPSSFSVPAPSTVEAAATSPVSTGWIVKSGDNICGLSDPKKLSNPAKVRYDELRNATPEIKKMKDKNIDPNSPEGIQLKQAAVDRIRKASDSVRKDKGHCSIWKKIRHKDGRSISDITD